MGQAGAQREPSMEEILASIRRIIENNDPSEVAQGQHEDDYDVREDRPAHDDRSADNESVEQVRTDASDDEFPDVGGEVEAPENDRVHEAAAVTDSGAAAATISLADVAARARAMPDSPLPEVSEAPAPVQAASIPAPVNDDISDRINDAVAEELRQALVSEDPIEALAAVAATQDDRDETQVSGQDAAESGHEAEAEAAEADASADRGGQLVSMQTGEKVAAAFGELTAAIAAGQTRSFDEIAEEMLKPMLTQWLDDNLPTLVERLVREEIERVSRGTRR